MRPIAQTLTVSLSVAASVIFLLQIIGVVWLALQNGSGAMCDAAVATITRTVSVDADDRMVLLPTQQLRDFQADSPRLWFAVSYSGQLIEHAADRRPALPFDLPYLGPLGRARFTSTGQSVFVCVDAKPMKGSAFVVMVGGANVGFGELTKSFISEELPIVVLVAFGFAATVAAGALLSARFVARSIGRVTSMALAIEPAAPHTSIPLVNVPAELVSLVSALNSAFREIDAFMQRQRRFLGNAAHELRTPLTLLRAKIDGVPDHNLRRELVRDVRRLTSLVSAMLDLARLKDNEIVRRPVNLSVLVKQVLADFTPIALDNDIELSLIDERNEPLIILGVEAALRSALANLIGNALNHAHGATSIVATVVARRVVISDDGVGLPKGEISKLLEPFQKGADSVEGFGLGLSIVQEIMLAHGGFLTISSAPGRGTVASLNFLEPLVAPTTQPL